MFLAKISWLPIVKTLNLIVWTLPLIFLHDFTLFVIDMHQNRPISLVLTPFDHFHFHALAALIWWVLLRSCHIWSLLRGCKHIFVFNSWLIGGFLWLSESGALLHAKFSLKHVPSRHSIKFWMIQLLQVAIMRRCPTLQQQNLNRIPRQGCRIKE